MTGVGLQTITESDLDWVARTVWGEAEGEPLEGKIAVASVIYNRARNPRWWGKNIKDACLTAKQFSAWNDSSNRRNRMGEPDLNDPIFRECFTAAVIAIDHDPTDGADHYYAHKTLQDPPAWAEGRDGVVIGGHTFYKLRDDR